MRKDKMVRTSQVPEKPEKSPLERMAEMLMPQIEEAVCTAIGTYLTGAMRGGYIKIGTQRRQ